MTTQPRTSLNASKKIERWNGVEIEVQAKVGACLKVGEFGEGRVGEALLPGDDFTCPGWPGCDFRFPTRLNPIACNVKITGRRVHHRMGDEWVRVRIEWVGDCEPSTFCSGWLLVDDRSIVR